MKLLTFVFATLPRNHSICDLAWMEAPMLGQILYFGFAAF